ncbi:hypothetical protein FQN54_004530 [Arachnomyces sp. PD_36]|nr:hypothetical protein FQN54_004530 [Arachnomyces sp. PD_36]
MEQNLVQSSHHLVTESRERGALQEGQGQPYNDFRGSHNDGIQVSTNRGAIHWHQTTNIFIADKNALSSNIGSICDVNYIGHHGAAKSRYYPGSCDWLLKDREEYITWKTSGRGGPSVLWIHGRVGFGKTVLVSQVIEDLNSDNDLKNPDKIPVFYFYIGLSDDAERQPAIIFRAFLKQLVKKSRVAKEALKDVISDIVEQEAPEDMIEAALLNQLHRAKRSRESLTDVFIVIDALDECKLEHKSRLLEKLARFSRSGLRLKLLLTARDLDGLTTLGKANISTRTLEILPADTRASIENYVRDKVRSEVLSDKPESDQKKLIQERVEKLLIKHANGLFLWVRLQLESIHQLDTQSWVEEYLQKPEIALGLGGVYGAIIERISGYPGVKRSKAFTVLTWLFCAVKPTPVQALLEALSLNLSEREVDQGLCNELKETPAKVTDLCGGLVEIDQSLDVFRFIHTSVKEFLGEIKLPDGLLIGAKGHSKVAEICLSYLCSKRFSRVLPEDTSWYRPVYRDDALLQFASCHWAQHTISGEYANEGLWLELCRSRKNITLSFQILLLSEHINPPKGLSPTHVISYLGLVGLVDTLHDNRLLDVRGADQYGRTALHWAVAGKGDNISPMAEKLILCGVDINASDNAGLTALYHAAGRGRLDAVSTLLGYKNIDVNAYKGASGTALTIASHRGHTNIVEKLVAKPGIDLNVLSPELGTPLQAAASSGSEGCVSVLLRQRRLKPHKGGTFLGSALHEAAHYGYDRIVERLLESQFDVNEMGGLYGSALQAAAAGPNPTVDSSGIRTMRLLLSKNPDVNATGGVFETALHAAAINGHIEMVKALVENRANVNAGSALGTPYEVAEVKGYTEVMDYLKERGVQPIPQDWRRAEDRYTTSPTYDSENSSRKSSKLRDILYTLPLWMFVRAVESGNPETTNKSISGVEKTFQFAIDKRQRRLIEQMAHSGERAFKAVIPSAVSNMRDESQTKPPGEENAISLLKRLTQSAVAVFRFAVAKARRAEAKMRKKDREGGIPARPLEVSGANPATSDNLYAVLRRLTQAAVTILSFAIKSADEASIQVISKAWAAALQEVIVQGGSDGLMEYLVQFEADRFEELFDQNDIVGAQILARVGVELLATALSQGPAYDPLVHSLSKLWASCLQRVSRRDDESRYEGVGSVLGVFVEEIERGIDANRGDIVRRYAEVGVSVILEFGSCDNRRLIGMMSKLWAKVWHGAIDKNMGGEIDKVVEGRMNQFHEYVEEENETELAKFASAGVAILHAAISEGFRDVEQKLTWVLIVLLQSTIQKEGKGKLVESLVVDYEDRLRKDAIDACTGMQDKEIGYLFITAGSLILRAKEERFNEALTTLSKSAVRVIDAVQSCKRDMLAGIIRQHVNGFEEGSAVGGQDEEWNRMFCAVVCLIQTTLTHFPHRIDTLVSLINTGSTLLAEIKDTAHSERDSRMIDFFREYGQRNSVLVSCDQEEWSSQE